MDNTQNEILKSVQKLTTTVDGLKNSVTDTLEIVRFLKDNAMPRAESVTKQEFSDLSKEVVRSGSQMVTKTYLDEKLRTLKGDVVSSAV